MVSNSSGERRIRAVVFDIGGVLETTPTTGWQARWEQRLQLAPDAIDQRLADLYRTGTVGSITLAEAERTIGQRLGLSPAETDELMSEMWTEYLGTKNRRLYDWFASLRPRYKTGIISNSWVGAREKEEARYAFSSVCDTIVYSHEEGIAKPDPRIYEIACERLDVAPSEVVFVDDLRANLVAAKALGMHPVLFAGDNAETIAELEALLG